MEKLLWHSCSRTIENIIVAFDLSASLQCPLCSLCFVGIRRGKCHSSQSVCTNQHAYEESYIVDKLCKS